MVFEKDRFIAILLLSASILPTADPVFATEAAPSISLESFVGDGVRSKISLSPDGRYLAWIEDKAAAATVVTAPTENVSDSFRISFHQDNDERLGKSVQDYIWLGNSHDVAISVGGDVRVVDLLQRTFIKEISGFSEFSIGLLPASVRLKDSFGVVARKEGNNKYNYLRFDVNRADYDKTVDPSPYFTDLLDVTLAPQVGWRPTTDGGLEFSTMKANFSYKNRVPLEASFGSRIVAVSDKGILYRLNGATERFNVLESADINAGSAPGGANSLAQAPKKIAQLPDSDIDMVVVDPRSKSPIAISGDRRSRTWLAVDEQFSPIISVLSGRFLTFKIVSQSEDNAKWIVQGEEKDKAPAYYLVSLSDRSVRLLFPVKPNLDGLVIPTPEPFEVVTSDGLSLVGYFTKPKGVSGVAPPAVVLPHGGPWERDHAEFDTLRSILVANGYAVIQVNFRGSSAYGRDFVKAGFGQWGTGMIRDIQIALEWALQHKLVDPKRLAIFGASYGGYAALMSAATFPTEYQCALSLNGPADLGTMERFYDDRPELRSEFALANGDARDPAVAAQLDQISPLKLASKIKSRLMLIYGETDANVNPEDTKQLYHILKEQGKSVDLVPVSKMGHDFGEQENRIYVMKTALEFLRGCLR